MYQSIRARPWRVTLQEAGDKFKFHYDCIAADADDAADAARKAYPGATVLHEAQVEGYVIYAKSEDGGEAGGFWSGTFGWVGFPEAQLFTPHEAETMSLPMSAGGDAKWLLAADGLRLHREASPNKNVLAGFCCPSCGSYGDFKIFVTKHGFARVSDGGAEFNGGDTEWGCDSPCACLSCGCSGKVADFQAGERQAVLKWFCVTGRVPGNDEDGCEVFHVATREEAIEEFRFAVWDARNDRDHVLSKYGEDLYINHVLVSDSPIRFVD